ncbi:hypothetical protein GHT06_005865 [Daphnia sinensis]|uniref:Ty3 transposon capsid-like protein domain-containing protein n=1 Tax=Daphnia sinensis TaxID=1820382 RepID=A0AAD5KGG8_9CRUS|nr:hypothetical protein GHT06_005865 [Daphnia sinensis]
MPFDSLVHKTTLDENTSPPLYPVLENSDSVDRNSNLSPYREKFVENWKNLIDLEHQIELEKAKKYQTTSTTGNIEQLETQKKEASLSLQSTLSASDGITAEVIENCTDTLKKEIVAQGVDIGKFNDLIRLKNTVHGNEKEFLFGIIEVLKKESALGIIEERKQTAAVKTELLRIQKTVEGDKKKSKSSKYTLSSSLEELQERNETLKNSLEKAQNRITELERNLQTTLATEQQLQSLLKKKEETNVVIETEGQENIAKLEGEKVELIRRLQTAEQQTKKAVETTQQLQKKIKDLEDEYEKVILENRNTNKKLKDITTRNNTLEEEVGKLISRLQKQESDIQNLEDRVKNYKKLQVQFIETDDNNDSRPIGDESEDISNFVGGIIDSTLPTDKSLHYELEVEQTGDFDQTVEDLRNQIELLNKTVGYLQQENQKLSNKINMGVTHDEDSTTSAPQQWGGSTTPQAIPPTASTSQGLPSHTNSKAHVTDPDEEEAIKKMSKFVTNPIVKAIGDLFSREDKKEIPTYKGKSTDKLITEWLKGAEHVARNNDWNDDQKIRLFSDRLKGEAFEWHENYAEEEGDNLNYPDWKEAIITRFQDKVDLATLENKFSKLKQKPEENCRAFQRKTFNPIIFPI